MNVTKWFAVALLMVFGLAGIAEAKEKKGGKEKWQLYCENNAGKYYYDPDAIAFGSEYMHFKVKYKFVPNEPEKEKLLTKIIKKSDRYGIILADLDLNKELIYIENEAEYLGKEKINSRDVKDFVRPLTWEEHKKLADIVVVWVQKWRNANPAKAEKYFAKGAKTEEACKAAESDLRNLKTTLEAFNADYQYYPKNYEQWSMAISNYKASANVKIEYTYLGEHGYTIQSISNECDKVCVASSEDIKISYISKQNYQKNKKNEPNMQLFTATN